MAEKEYSIEYVRHNFSEDEKKEIASEMARKVSEVHSLEDELKAVKSDYKSQIDAAQASVNSAASKLNNGYEMRQVKCEIVKDFTRKIIQFNRTDTGETVKEKRMSSDDLQMKIV